MTETHTPRNFRISIGGFCLALISILGCSGDAPLDPVHRIPLRYNTSQDDATYTLGVAINGANRVTSEGYVTYRRIVHGGSGHYHYDWFQAYCYGDGGTPYCSDLALMQSGEDTSFTVFYPAEIGKMQIVLHVFDDQQPPDQPYGGSASAITIGIFPPSYTNPDFSCDLGEQYWPIADINPAYYPDSTKWYRRNGCTGAKEWKPASP